MSLCRVSRRHFYTSVALAYAGSDTCSKSQINSNHIDQSIHIEREGKHALALALHGLDHFKRVQHQQKAKKLVF